MRIGQGYDAHRLVSGRKLVLGGVEIPHTLGLDGHSDADVLTHAIMDAILGAAALGDIGTHFPPGDFIYKDACSIELLGIVANKIDLGGYHILNLDTTIVAQQPKLGGYIKHMRGNIARALGLNSGQVSVKATTEEEMGFTGRGEGISAHAIVLIAKKDLI